MKAVLFYEQGDVDKLIYENVAEPVFSPKDVLVKVKACAINHLDLRARFDRPEVEPYPHILGSDIAGEIAEIGSEVENVQIGDRVVIYPSINCGICEDCIKGHENLCNHQKIIGFQTNGGYAEYVKVPAKNVITFSGDLPDHKLAAIPIAYLTAWHMLVTKAQVKAGDDVLILSAGSGVGSAALQIAKLSGARIFVTASTDVKLQHAKEMGADFGINYTEEDFCDSVRNLTDGRGVDIVFEHVGQATWEKSFNSLAKNGKLVACGVTSGNMGPINIRHLYQREISIMGAALGNKKEFMQVIKVASENKLEPIIDRLLPLKDAAKAHKIMESRKNFGKIILEP